VSEMALSKLERGGGSWSLGRIAVVLAVTERGGGSLRKKWRDMDKGSMFGKRAHLLKLLHINIQLTAQFVLCLGKGRYLTGQLMRLVKFCILLFAESFLLGEMELDFELLAAE
jgi:hypothetical protein